MPNRTTESRPSPSSSARWLPLILVAIVAATFANTLSNGYVWDDFDILVDNPETHDLGNLGKVLLSPDLTPPYYRPLPRASFLLEVAMFGANPVVSHATGLLLHLGAAVLLFFLARRLTREPAVAFAAALLWAVHPVGAEAVGMASLRTSPMAVLFMLASLLSAWRAWESGSKPWALVSGLLMLSAFGSKEQALFTLPLAAVLVWLSPQIGGPPPSAARAGRVLALPAIALVAYLAARVVSLGGLLGSVPPSAARYGAMGPLDMVSAAGHYLVLLVWPARLTVLHDLSGARTLGIAAFAVLVAATALSVKFPSPARTFGWAWFWATLLPTLQVVALPSAAFAERHAYFLAVGLALVIADTGASIVRWRPSHAVRIGAAVLAAAAAIGLSARTIVRSADWRDNRSLFESSLRVHATSTAHLNLGNEAMRRNDMAAAEEHWMRAIEIDPGDADALNQLGVLAGQRMRFLDARDYFERALAAVPDHPVAKANLARLPRLPPKRPRATGD